MCVDVSRSVTVSPPEHAMNSLYLGSRATHESTPVPGSGHFETVDPVDALTSPLDTTRK